MAEKRYVGLDVHKQFIMVAMVTKEQEIIMRPRSVATHQFEEWAKEYLRETDEVGLEACTNAWWVHDTLEGVVEEIKVANTHKLKMISFNSQALIICNSNSLWLVTRESRVTIS